MAQHVATAAVVKVSIGSPSGNRVAAFIQRGDVVPEGVAEEQLKRLIDRGLIEKVKAAKPESSTEVTVPEGDPSDKWTVPQLELFAKQKEIDLGSASSKPEKLAVIAAATTKSSE